MRAGPYADVAKALAGTPFASIHYVEETASTNADAAELLANADAAGRTIIAEYQSRGAGRKGRAWHAAAGTSLLFSTILPQTVAAERLWIVPFWTALCVRAALRECGVETILQWPNDVLLGDRKIAGVLCQSSVTAASARVACGVGINVHRWREAETAVVPPPAFCDDVAPVDRRALLHAVLRKYPQALPLLEQPERVTGAWESAAQLPGRRYRIAPDAAEGPFEAIAEGLESGGGLRVAREDGSRAVVALADARVLR
ncbi:MAG: biotin--[acetyl-CoA-carboxylase] ligase [Candidatus Eremiobacteraeota bacterium]|nr:biotin--[acetyl-CoA-carboxylase] ligase [Candidatus Eremiobacteraeota bacterium]MBV8500010.1 biotin--[acetyl-CoA-carboxylase] ligase [Candidatus Eremiobacteraeota bacterium]